MIKSFIITLCFVTCHCGGNEKRLLNDLNLTAPYKNLERPTLNESLSVPLSIYLDLQQLIDLDEKNQILTTNIWLTLTWEDPQLTWNPLEYNNLRDIRVDPSMIWTPDLLLYNSANENFDSKYPSNIIIYNNGKVEQIPPGIFKSTCQVDIVMFPFDNQNCRLKFGTWTYNERLVNLTLPDGASFGWAGNSSYQENAEWVLISAFGTRNTIEYDGIGVFIDVTYEINIQRKTVYYFNNLIAPCIVIASMVIFGFQTPPDSGEKLTLCITILMSLTFFMNMVSAMMPPTSDTPLIGIYFSLIMVMVACSVVCTVLILNYHKRTVDSHSMPFWVETIFLHWLPWLLRMEHPNKATSFSSILSELKMKQMEELNTMNMSPDLLHYQDDFVGKLLYI